MTKTTTPSANRRVTPYERVKADRDRIQVLLDAAKAEADLVAAALAEVGLPNVPVGDALRQLSFTNKDKGKVLEQLATEMVRRQIGEARWIMVSDKLSEAEKRIGLADMVIDAVANSHWASVFLPTTHQRAKLWIDGGRHYREILQKKTYEYEQRRTALEGNAPNQSGKIAGLTEQVGSASVGGDDAQTKPTR
jgi:hypothetical protein